ncbi:WD40 repeat domain-containing protein [Streptomyces sp. NPDC018955]|uniref:WD40 repeat domain-containing protein n=1 Tax=Streptomyces sp. NPDC018955 TaxID=3365055 RepID=UPI00379B1699
MSPGQRSEHAAHQRALRASRDFAGRHLTEQAYPPYPVGDGRTLTFQSSAGGSLRGVETMARLDGEELMSAFRAVVTGLVTDWSPDGCWAAAGDNGDVLLWETAEWRRAGVVPVGAGVNDLAFAPGGSQLTAATTSMELRVVRLDPAGRPTGTVDERNGHAGSVGAVSWSPDGRHLATAGYDGRVLLWNPVAGRPCRVLPGDGTAVWSVTMSRDGSRLIAVTMGGSAFLWDTGTGTEVCRLRVDDRLPSCSFHLHDDRVVLGGSAGLYLCAVPR